MKKFFLILSCLISISAFALDTQRSRPAEWDSLVFGGRFVDLFLPVPATDMTSDVWGLDKVKPRSSVIGIEDSEYSYWGGNIILGDDGKYHLFVCRWEESAFLGHNYWPHSTVVHAVSDTSFGPFKVVKEIGKGHNPEVYRLKDGSYVLYVIGGAYRSQTINGDWDYFKLSFNRRGRKIHDGLSNLSFAQREDGSILMVCRGGGIWVSRDGLAFSQVSNKSVYPAVAGEYEDPVIWRTENQYHLIVNDWYGRIAYHLRSKNGIDWTLDPGEAYLPGIDRYSDGTLVDWYKFERMKIFQDSRLRVTQANFAVIDTIKNDDKPNDNHSSKNIVIPIEKEKILSMEESVDKVSGKSVYVVRIEAESDFFPNEEVDIELLRFGSPNSVNFGRGAKAVSSSNSGEDLIVVFESDSAEFGDDDFVGRLLGQSKSGRLIHGYARLGWVDYSGFILSSTSMKIRNSSKSAKVFIDIENFGHEDYAGGAVEVCITKKGKTSVVKGFIPRIPAYSKVTVVLDSQSRIDYLCADKIEVIAEGQKSPLIVK
ncbi:MAG: glycoside hydrolase family protein [Spirochaetales bacterium]|nr:glycoside hydrolase family protein [Spirochaetales bacterium]